MASVAGRSRSSRRLHNRGRCSEWVVRVVVRWCVGSTCHLRALIRCRVFVLIPILASLGIARISAHPDIATYAYATALFSDGAAEGSAFCEARELLRAVHLQDFRLDLETVSDVGVARRGGPTRVFHLVMVLCALELLVQAETQTEVTLVSNGQVREDKVPGWVRTIQIDHASNRCTGKNSGLVWVGHATRLCQVPGRFQCGEKEVVGVHHESDVFRDFLAAGARLEFQHLELDNWWRINRSAIGRSLRVVSTRRATSKWEKTYTWSQNHMRERARAVGIGIVCGRCI